MSTLAHEPGVPSADVIRAQVDAVLSSELFARAPSLAQFLSYVCRKALNGEADQIKEYSIAVEALGRSPDFDQKEDAIVRVEAHRLRKRLKQYYETAGASHAIQIVIPPGQYVPMFVPKPVPPECVTASETPGGTIELPVTLDSSGGSNGSVAGDGCRTLAPVIEILPPTDLPARRPRRLKVVAAGAAVVVLAAVIGVVLYQRSRPSAPAGGTDERSALPLPTGQLAEEGIRIACGFGEQKFVDSLGNVWLGDRYFLGGAALSSPPERILRTRDPQLYQNRREGDFRYRIPLDPGVYELRLHFAERVFGADNLGGGGETTRLFHVFANGVPVVENMDVINDAGGSNTANVRVYTDIRPAPDGFLHLQFSSFKEKAFVNAIEILPGEPGRLRPVRILAGNLSHKDAAGNLWTGDRYSMGGQSIVRPGTVSGTPDPGLYRSERFGNFSYAIPVADGKYTVNLYFAEAWFGADKPAGGGAGSREFDVTCNGVALLRSFDIYKAAGGPNRAVVKSFRGITPNAQGTIVLTFSPVVNYAAVNAIEVISER